MVEFGKGKSKRRYRQKRCIHFRGNPALSGDGPTCKAGRDIRSLSVREERFDGGLRLPCLEGGPNCPDRRFLTDEEEARREAEKVERFGAGFAAIAAIQKALPPFKRGTMEVGRIDCPVCGTSEGLAYQRSGSNGHIWATCIKKGCVSIIQ